QALVVVQRLRPLPTKRGRCAAGRTAHGQLLLIPTDHQRRAHPEENPSRRVAVLMEAVSQFTLCVLCVSRRSLCEKNILRREHRETQRTRKQNKTLPPCESCRLCQVFRWLLLQNTKETMPR